MLFQEERAKLLEEALSRTPVAWRRGTTPTAPDQRFEMWMEADAPTRPDQERLAVRLRPDGDVQVEYHINGKRGTPFELLLGPCHGREAECAARAAQFVADLVAERLVLAYDGRLLRGGRRFLKPSELNEPLRRHLKWVRSWQGTHDWER